MPAASAIDLVIASSVVLVRPGDAKPRSSRSSLTPSKRFIGAERHTAKLDQQPAPATMRPK